MRVRDGQPYRRDWAASRPSTANCGSCPARVLGAEPAGRIRCQQSFFPQDGCDSHRRRGAFGPHRRDHLGHAHVSMTQDVYMKRGRIHAQVAELLDRAVAVHDESAVISGE